MVNHGSNNRERGALLIFSSWKSLIPQSKRESQPCLSNYRNLPSVTESEAKLYLSMKLFEIGRLSCGQAAELAGYSKCTYMELLGRHGVPVMDYPASELQDDLGNA